MPLRSIFSQLYTRVGAVEASVVDVSANVLPAVNSAVASIQAGLSSYALASDLSGVSASLSNYALASDLSGVSASLSNYALDADLSALSTIVAAEGVKLVDLSGAVSGVIATTGLLSLEDANQAALLAAASLSASTIAANLVLNELADSAVASSVSALTAVVTDLSGVVSTLSAAPGFDSTALEAAIADLSGVRVASLEASVSGLAQSLSQTDGNVGALQTAVAGKVSQDAFNSFNLQVNTAVENLGSAIAAKADASAVEARGVRSKNVVYVYQPEIWSADAAVSGTPQLAAGQASEGGSLVVVHTMSPDNATRNAVHLSSPGSLSLSDGDLRRFCNTGAEVLRIKDSNGVVLAELLGGEVAAIMWLAASSEWVLVSGF